MFYLQALIPFVAGPSFNKLYGSTVRTFPAAFIYVVIGLKTLVFVDVLIIYLKSRKVQKKMKQLEMRENKGENFKSTEDIEHKKLGGYNSP